MMFLNNKNEYDVEQRQKPVMIDRREQRFCAEFERLLKLRLRTNKSFTLHRRHSCPSTLTAKVVVIDMEGVGTRQQHHRRCSVPRRASFCDNMQQCTSASASTCVTALEEKPVLDFCTNTTSVENDMNSSAKKEKSTTSRRKSLTQRQTRVQVNSALNTVIDRIQQSTSYGTTRLVYTGTPPTTTQFHLFWFRTTLVKASFFLIIVLMFMTLRESSNGGVNGAVLKSSCRKVGE